MNHIAEVSIAGLFGYADHTVSVRPEEPTVLLGPNGAGKTHVLRLTAAALAMDTATLFRTVYGSLTVTFRDGRSLTVDRTQTTTDQLRLEIKALPEYARKTGLILTDRELEAADLMIPAEVRKVGANRWFDERSGRSYTPADIERRYGVQVDLVASRLAQHPEIAALCSEPHPVFIDTWRLDTRVEDSALPGGWGRMRHRSSSSAASRIRAYTDQLREEIGEARRSSVRATQSADLSFARRALDAAGLSVNESKLHERYDRTVERYETLARNGLAVGEAPIPFPEKTSPTVRRILSVFLDDWDKRLEPLLPVNEKLQVLRESLDSKLEPSGKRTGISARGGLEFYNSAGRRLLVSRLSSGEQHLVALFTLLLFAAKRGSVVLIDEPEISLHAAWKHSFLLDVARIANVNNLQVIVATHSSGIVNGRWDLVEELDLQVASGGPDVGEDGVEDEEDIDV